MTALAWQDQAACRGMDTDLFYGEGPRAIARAKKVCARCPVQAECLAYVRTVQPDGEDDWGVFGGTSPTDRNGGAGHARRGVLSEARARRAYQEAKAGAKTVAQLAAELEVTDRTLQRAWRRYGLASLTGRSQPPRRSRALTDRTVAQAAFALAEAAGINAAAEDFGISRTTLERVWQRHGLGRPDTAAANARNLKAHARIRPNRHAEAS